MELTFEDALRIARGCTDYGGGHRSNPEHYEIYQHGIQTVISALTAASKTGLEDMQTRALHAMGANAAAVPLQVGHERPVMWQCHEGQMK